MRKVKKDSCGVEVSESIMMGNEESKEKFIRSED